MRRGFQRWRLTVPCLTLRFDTGRCLPRDIGVRGHTRMHMHAVFDHWVNLDLWKFPLRRMRKSPPVSALREWGLGAKAPSSTTRVYLSSYSESRCVVG